MKHYLITYKPIGYTLSQIIKLVKRKYPQYKNKKIAYAGRLDPMARGVLLLLVEPETKNRHKYQKLDKEYIFKVLFGVETDTYDVLGLIPKEILRQAQDDSVGLRIVPTQSNIKMWLKNFEGKREQPYPPFSSKTVKGKPLFWWAREGRLGEIEIPAKEVNIYSIKLLKVYKLTKKGLSGQVIRRLSLVKGNFRQEAIIKSWKHFFKTTKQQKFKVAKIKIQCSSGTYVRQIAHEIGQNLGCGALALDILRTRIGNYTLKNAHRLK